MSGKRRATRLGHWLKAHNQTIRRLLLKSPDIEDRNLARELDRMLTEMCGEDY